MKNKAKCLSNNKNYKDTSLNIYSIGSGNVITLGKKFSNNVNVHGKGVKFKLADGSSLDVSEQSKASFKVKDGILAK